MQNKILEKTFLPLVILSLITSCTPNLTTSSVNTETSTVSTNISKYLIKGKAEFPQLSLNPSLAKRGTSGNSSSPSLLTPHSSLFTTQATLGEIAPQATVSIIYPSDHSTYPNVTIATGLTDGSGNFIINPSATLNPAVNSVYILEASKRIGDAGNSLMSIRTYIRWNGTGWDSMTTPGIFINTKTTALAVIQNNLKAQVSALDTIGKINVTGGTSVPEDIGTFITAQTVTDVSNLVTQVLADNFDPMYYIKYVSGQYKIVLEIPGINPVTANLKPNMTNVTLTGFTASWTAIPDCTYNLIITKVSDNSEVLNQSLGTSTTYNVTTLTPGTLYKWKIKATNTINNLNKYSSEVMIGLLDTPLATSATNTAPISFTANWNAVPNATGYKLFVDGVQYPNSSTVIPGTTYNITNLPWNASSHSYYVIALNQNGESPNSNTISFTTPGLVATSPTNIAKTSFTANWNAVPNATGYKLYVNGVRYPDTTTVISTNSYNVTGISPLSVHNYYVTAYNLKGESSNSNTVTFSNAIVTTFAGGTGTNALFSDPAGVAVDSSGNVYVADATNYNIRKITSGGVVTTIAGSTAGFADGTNAQFNLPQGVAVDSDGNIYVADTSNYRIRKITPAGYVSTFAGNATRASVDGNGTNAQFWGPYAIAIDSSDNLYVADTFKVRKITPTGDVTTIAGNGSGYADGNGTNALFKSMRGIAVDSSGNLYVADPGNYRIRKINPAGDVSTFAGDGTNGYLDGNGTNAQFNNPRGIAVDTSGNVYVTDGNTIRKITPAGDVTTIAGSAWGYLDDNGTYARFNGTWGIATDSSGTLYVGDSGNSRIRKIE